MGLLAPTPGEVADRQTIIELKIDAAKQKNLSFSAFSEEYGELQSYLGRNSFATSSPEYQGLYTKLKDVNTKLWNIEDEIRLIIRQSGEASKLSAEQKIEVCRISFEIPRLNDQRAELVQQVNRLFNVDRREKFYN